MSLIKKRLPQLGGSNVRNIDAMVAAGEITKEEGERLKKRFEEARKKKAEK